MGGIVGKEEEKKKGGGELSLFAVFVAYTSNSRRNNITIRRATAYKRAIRSQNYRYVGL